MGGYELLKFRAFATVARGTIQCCAPGCPVRHLSMLHLDHIANDGAKHRRKHSKAAGVHIYRWVVKHPELARKRLQILCANHDRAKQKLGSVEAIVQMEYLHDNTTE